MIWFAGDTHGQFDHISRAIDTAGEKPTAVVLLGDIEAPMPLTECMREVEKRGVEWFWIVGNHDSDCSDAYENLSDPASLQHCLDGRVITIDGISVAGLGGVFREEIWYPGEGQSPKFHSYDDYTKSMRDNRRLKSRLSKRDLIQAQAVPPESRHWASEIADFTRTGKLLKHRSSIFPDVFERLSRTRADILVTHEAPSVHKYGFDAIDSLANSMGAKQIFHGHHHIALEYANESEMLGFAAYGVGLRGITDQAGVVVRAGIEARRVYGRVGK